MPVSSLNPPGNPAQTLECPSNSSAHSGYWVIFFWDPLEPQPHDPDVKALLRMAVVWDIPIACNRSSADFMISSPLMDSSYDRMVPDYDQYRTRKMAGDE